MVDGEDGCKIPPFKEKEKQRIQTKLVQFRAFKDEVRKGIIMRYCQMCGVELPEDHNIDICDWCFDNGGIE